MPTSPDEAADATPLVRDPRRWRDNGWTAQVVKNEDDDGWAVAMIKDGEPEPALVGPWTMGRDKKSPKPLDAAAFNTLVKTANEVLGRHEQQLHALHHRSVTVEGPAGRVRVSLEIVPDEDDPHARLTAHDAQGETLAQVGVTPEFRLTVASARAWIEDGYGQPG